AAVDGGTRVAGTLEQALDEVADLLVVVDDENLLLDHACTASPRRTRRTVSTSSEGVNGFCRNSDAAETSSTSSGRSMYPDTNMTRVSGRRSTTILASFGPLICGITTSLSNRSIRPST